MIIIILFFIFVLFITLLFYLKKSNNKTPVYCLMITGKDNKRLQFAKISVTNFLQQTYKNKHLIIINEGKDKVIQKDYKNILEINIDRKKSNISLGQLRNMSMDLVPIHAIWTTWDDDDWRHSNYLDIMCNQLIKSKKNFLMYKNRLEYNFNTKFTFKVTINSGTYIFFGFKNPKIKYNNTNTKEDIPVKKYIMNSDHELFDNDPKLYIRTIHSNNTSIFVNPKKNKIDQHNVIVNEQEATKNEKIYVKNIVNKYYNII